MFRDDDLAIVIKDLFDGVANTDNLTISLITNVKKFYETYTNGLPNTILGNLVEMAYAPADVKDVESVTASYAIEMLVPENALKETELIFKTLQLNATGVLIDLDGYEDYSNYTLALTFKNYSKGLESVVDCGNCYRAVVYVDAVISNAVVNGSEFSFKITDEDTNTEYALDALTVTAGDVINAQAGNYNAQGIIGVKPLSQSKALTATGILKKNSFAKDVIFDGLFGNTNWSKKYLLTITGYDTISYTMDVVLTRPTLVFDTKTGMMWTLTMNIAG